VPSELHDEYKEQESEYINVELDSILQNSIKAK